jgi:hypothetical protein
MRIITRHPLLILIAAHLVSLAAVCWYNAPPGHREAPQQGGSQSTGNPFVLADVDGRTQAPRPRITIELRFAPGAARRPTVFIPVSDGLDRTGQRV